MNNGSLKKYVLRQLEAWQASPDFEQNRIILVTSFGMIHGDCVRKFVEGDEVTERNAVHAIVDTAAKKFREGHDNVEVTPGNDGYIYLKNVAIKDSKCDGEIHLPELVVFLDQIIAVTLEQTK